MSTSCPPLDDQNCGNNSESKITVRLDNSELWKQFDQIGTEMIITKSGRRMFPSLEFRLTGLEPHASYFLLVDMLPVDNCRYKYYNDGWFVLGRHDDRTHVGRSRSRIYVHPDSPATGQHWMQSKRPVSFCKLKLTNNTDDRHNHILLSSMHRYQPRLIVVKISDDVINRDSPLVNTFTFAETSFMAVTAYQNERITKLKIKNNPFANGFRKAVIVHNRSNQVNDSKTVVSGHRTMSKRSSTTTETEKGNLRKRHKSTDTDHSDVGSEEDDRKSTITVPALSSRLNTSSKRPMDMSSIYSPVLQRSSSYWFDFRLNLPPFVSSNSWTSTAPVTPTFYTCSCVAPCCRWTTLPWFTMPSPHHHLNPHF